MFSPVCPQFLWGPSLFSLLCFPSPLFQCCYLSSHGIEEGHTLFGGKKGFFHSILGFKWSPKQSSVIIKNPESILTSVVLLRLLMSGPVLPNNDGNGWSNNITSKALALYMGNLDSILSTPYGPESSKSNTWMQRYEEPQITARWGPKAQIVMGFGIVTSFFSSLISYH